MSLKYNFALKYNVLKKWIPKVAEEKKAPISFDQKLNLIIKYIKDNPIVFYPQIILFSSFIFIQLLSLYPKYIIYSLKPIHEEYDLTTQKINRINSKLNRFKKELKDLEPSFKSITPTYLFTFYLQNSIPIDLELQKYKLNNNHFFIKANSYSLKPINEMISLLIEIPIIDERSVEIKKIQRDNSNGTITVEITGKILKSSLAKKELLYKESLASGLLKKLSRFRKTLLLLK